MAASDSPSLADLRIDRTREDAASRSWIGWLLLVVLLIALGAGTWWYWGSTPVTVVTTAPVRVTEAGAAQPTVLNASGYVTARRRATVSSKITGKVTEVLVEEGMTVRRGQVLARLDDASERSYVALATAQVAAAGRALDDLAVRLDEATLHLSRTRRLVEEGVVADAELDTAQAEVDSLTARIALAREQVSVAERELEVRETALEDTVIRAPFDGVAISKDAQPGETISPVSAGGGFTRTGIGTIVDMSSLEIEVDVNESFINRVSPDQRVVANLDAYPDWDIPATVITTVPAADRQRATVLVRIAFDALDPRILPDMGIKVAFLETAPPTETVAASRLWIPQDAVRREDGRSIVFVVRGEAVERRAITAGLRDGADVEVVSGLDAGERIVVDPPDTLADGDPVDLRGSSSGA